MDNRTAQTLQKQAFTAEHNGAITTTNTVEGMHGVLKNKARRLNLFSGQPSKGEAMRRKISELVYRINHRNLYADDFLLLFLHLLCVYYPCCSDIEIDQRLKCISLWDETAWIVHDGVF